MCRYLWRLRQRNECEIVFLGPYLFRIFVYDTHDARRDFNFDFEIPKFSV